MDELKLFAKHAPNRTFIAIIAGSLAGVLYALLIPVVIKTISNDETNFVIKDKVVQILGVAVAHSQFAILFVSICLLIFALKTTSEILLCDVLLHIRFKLRQELYSRIQESPLASLEAVGQSRMIQVLSADVLTIVNGAQLLPELISNTVVILGMLGYLSYLDIHAFTYVLEVIAFGVVTYQIPIIFGTRKFKQARDYDDQLQEAFKGLIVGAKELKLSTEKRMLYERDELFSAENGIREHEKIGRNIFSAAKNYGSLTCFFAIGGLTFVFINYRHMSADDVTAAVMVLLYVTNPIAALLNFSPYVAKTRIALKKVNQLYRDLPRENISATVKINAPWSTLRLRGVGYRHDGTSVGGNAFEIGPIDLDVERGSVTFITGGNGSGKSTLAKIISQHYMPSSGEVCVDGGKLDRDNINGFRNEVFCIYSDYYLFSRLLHADSMSSQFSEKVRFYIDAFELGGKVQFGGGRFSTLALSDGQRRRLALVVAVVEEKPLYVFDEWAADQDPRFKRIFYYEILPFLKGRNSAVVVISHDDRYFHVADRIVVMESGRILTVAGKSK